MVPSPDVAWLEASLTGEQALAVVVETSHERYPVGDASRSTTSSASCTSAT